MLAAAPPDLLLLDMKMPGMSGLDVLREIRERRVEVLTVMITAYATLETAIEATKSGAHDFLPKPFTPEDLRVAVRRAVRHLLVQREARRLAQEKRQVRFQFISVLGHELKAPLAAVEGFLQILKDGSAGSDPAVIASVIDRALARTEGMRKLIVDLLNLTRIESGQKRRELVQADLRAAAAAAMETVAADAQRRGIIVGLHAPDAAPMLADRGELEIILNNLLTNAVKYNRDGGRVDVTLEPVDTGWRDPRRGYRHRHDARGLRAAVPGVRADQERPDPAHPRHRTGPLHREAARPALRRRRHRRKHARLRQHVHGRPPLHLTRPFGVRPRTAHFGMGECQNAPFWA